MENFNHFLLVIARESRGKSQIELAKELNLDQGHLSRIEQGIITNPSQEIIANISKKLNYPITFFYQSDTKTPINDFFYRKRITLPAKEKNKLEAQIEIIRLVFDKLSNSIDLPSLKLPNLSVNANFRSTDIALTTREFFGIKRGPVKNLISLLERHGITVIYLNVDSQKFDGVTVYTNKNHPLIILNKNMPNDRKRFSLAHELGHQIMHLPFRYDFEIYERIKSNPDSFEDEADIFASEFLIPTAECRNDLVNLTYGKLSNLKLYWNISKRAIVYKAKFINAITDDRYKSLMVELSRRGERVRESFDVEIDEPKVFNEVFKVHIEKLGYSIDELSRLVHLNRDDFKNYISENSNSKLRIAI
jgi:Zn-dependent peptidase ImmA (M78 family)/DNA-binding XRE family transcriptional regulator